MTLQQFLAKVILPARASSGADGIFEQVMECVAVPSLREKSGEQNADVIGILKIVSRGRAFGNRRQQRPSRLAHRRRRLTRAIHQVA